MSNQTLKLLTTAVFLLALLVWAGVGYLFLNQQYFVAQNLLKINPNNEEQTIPSMNTLSGNQLESFVREYLITYASKEKGENTSLLDVPIRIFDLRPEEEYFIGHIQHASLTTHSALEFIATEGLLADKTVIILTSSGQDERLINLVKHIKDTGAGKVYLEPNFDPEQISTELIEVVLNPPSPL